MDTAVTIIIASQVMNDESYEFFMNFLLIIIISPKVNVNFFSENINVCDIFSSIGSRDDFKTLSFDIKVGAGFEVRNKQRNLSDEDKVYCHDC